MMWLLYFWGFLAIPFLFPLALFVSCNANRKPLKSSRKATSTEVSKKSVPTPSSKQSAGDGSLIETKKTALKSAQSEKSVDSPGKSARSEQKTASIKDRLLKAPNSQRKDEKETSRRSNRSSRSQKSAKSHKEQKFDISAHRAQLKKAKKDQKGRTLPSEPSTEEIAVPLGHTVYAESPKTNLVKANESKRINKHRRVSFKKRT